MYKIQILTNVNGDKWNKDLLQSYYSTFYQTFEYLKFSANQESFPIFVNILDDEERIVSQLGILIIRTTALYGSHLFRKILKIISSISSRGVWLYGPVIHTGDKEERKEILKTMIDATTNILEKYNLVFIEGYSPPLDDSIDEDFINEYKKNGYSVNKYVTFITNLKKPLEEIWGNVQKYTKTNVKRAEKRGISVKKLETFNEAKENIVLFQKWSETKGLTISDLNQELEKFWDRHNSGFEKTFLAYKDQQLVSSITISCFNEVIIPLQVINSYSIDARNLAGPALTWKAIKESKKLGFKIYDITGGPLLSENEYDPDNTRPLTHYKKKWGGKQHTHYHFLKINKKISYILYLKLFKLIRWHHQRSNNRKY
jgi:lipid II:glycine glycyltransferase (peptidoglycan interpeptide bridge formation enzyme)